MKKLSIRFVRFERAIVVQQLEMTGKEHFTPSEHVALWGLGIDFADEAIWLSRSCDINIGIRLFNHNAERDEYLNKVVNWISEEQFSTGRKLKIGEKCLFSDDGEDWHSGEYAGKCAKQLGEPRFLALDGDVSLTRWKYVEPLYGALKKNGDLYSWKMEVE